MELAFADVVKYTIPVLFVVDLGDGVAFEDKEKALPHLTDCLHFAAQHECGPMASNLANGDIDGMGGRRFHVDVDVCWPESLADGPPRRRKRPKRANRLKL